MNDITTNVIGESWVIAKPIKHDKFFECEHGYIVSAHEHNYYSHACKLGKDCVLEVECNNCKDFKKKKIDVVCPSMWEVSEN